MYGFVKEWKKDSYLVTLISLDPYFVEKTYIQKNITKH